MAQAFEILMETGQRPGHAFLPDGILTSSPDTLSRSPFPAGRPIRWIDISNMGLPSVRRKRANGGSDATCGGSDSKPGDPAKVNQSGRL
jgi:hypothetical protein